MSNEEKIWSYLMHEISNPFGVAGLMGNIKAESNFNPCNLQNSYESRLHYTDISYTEAVDCGDYPKSSFCHDSAGYGLCQWTYWSRKESLYDYARQTGDSIGGLFTQLSFMCAELRSYGLIDVLKNTKSVKEASDIIMIRYERPKDQSEEAKERRAKMGMDIYKAHINNGIDTQPDLFEKIIKIEEIISEIKTIIKGE